MHTHASGVIYYVFHESYFWINIFDSSLRFHLSLCAGAVRPEISYMVCVYMRMITNCVCSVCCLFHCACNTMFYMPISDYNKRMFDIINARGNIDE